MIVAAQLAVSPAVAFHSTLGMETPLAMVLVLFVAYGSMKLVANYDLKVAAAMYVGLFAAMLTRPDVVVFGVFLLAGLAGVLFIDGRERELKQLVGLGFVLVFVPGILFIILRMVYFGYPFPNPMYVKSGSSISAVSLSRVFQFVMLLGGPVMFITLFLGVEKGYSKDAIKRVLPVFSGAVVFTGMWLFFQLIQGLLWRFQLTVFPAILLGFLYLLTSVDIQTTRLMFDRQSSKKALLSVLLISGLLVYPLFPLRDAGDQTSRTAGDRIEAGQALSEFSDKEYRMFVSESGATPYYSEWTASDHLGLNSEQIAHQGMSTAYLRQYDPDLIQIVAPVRPSAVVNNYPHTSTYLNDSSFKFAAAIYKQNPQTEYVNRQSVHYYFVDAENPDYQNITCSLNTLDLSYMNTSVAESVTKVRIDKTNITRKSCDT